MIFHPGILALVSGSALVTLMMMYAAFLGGVVVVRWDFQSSSAGQLSLERKTCLISTIMNYVLGFQVVSTFLFIYTVDDIHKLFVGAMCATGSLNANPVGWQALLSKIIVCFAAGFWIVMNYLDQTAEDYPLVRLKYSILIILLPLFVGDSFLQLRYFLGLDPDIITSCCGSLFSESGGGVASGLSGLPVKQAMTVFYLVSSFLLVVSFLCLYSKKTFLRYLHTFTAFVLIITALAGMVSFVSIYIYELPSHHCPFDMFQGHYGFIGYPLYISLFCGVFFGMLPGIFHPLRRIASLRETLQRIEKRWIVVSMSSVLLFMLIATYRITTSNLTYISY
ncbi:MAG: nucleoporin NDC1 [Desulfobulbaceae bacterium]|nr:nucleoporin NDC1 [Desulfobulbaceae bacterium]